ncbi:MAG TPA: outer membrane beta-barrel protein, partial [Gemmatimonadales bacterium]|nr:outer membrane beta-barrel protein [Gemmatimonadales bacterium]
MRLLSSALVAVLVAVVVGHPAMAQGKKIRFGVTGGVNFATWTGDDVGTGLKRRTGFNGGGIATMELSPALAVQTGLLYSQEGTGADFGG